MNNYEILGLKKGASISEVKSKFRALSKKYHPDMPGGNAAKFISIREAYTALLKGDSGEPQFTGGFGSGYDRDSRYQQQDDRFWKEFNRQAQQQSYSNRQQWEQQKAYQQSRERYKGGEFRFEGIVKDKKGYLIKFYLKDIKKVKIFGKNSNEICRYTTNHVNGTINLVVKWEDAEKADYYFRVRLEDDYNFAEKIYKVKPPETKWEKIINKLKFWK